MNELEIKALEFAISQHEGQTYNGKSFVVHPFETWEVIKLRCPNDINLRVAALLHDTLEDTVTNYEELKRFFNDDVANLVREVTKTEYNTFPNLKTQRGVILKFADRLCNISNMDNWDEERKQKYMFVKSRFWK